MRFGRHHHDRVWVGRTRQNLGAPGVILLARQFCLAVGNPPAIFNASEGHATGETIHDMDRWQAWQPGMVGPLVDAGQTVFVDVTAAWCITCQANKSLVIEQAPVCLLFGIWLSLAN